MIEVRIECVACQSQHKILVEEQAWNRYVKGESYVQELFPELSKSDRELLISRVCGKCFDKMFGGKKK